MKQELITFAQKLAEQLDESRWGKSIFDMHKDALEACYTLEKAIGTGYSPEDLPDIVDLYQGIINTLPCASMCFDFWKEEGDENTECDTWQECTRGCISMTYVSLTHERQGKLENMGSHIADCIYNAVNADKKLETCFDTDRPNEWYSIYR